MTLSGPQNVSSERWTTSLKTLRFDSLNGKATMRVRRGTPENGHTIVGKIPSANQTWFAGKSSMHMDDFPTDS